MIWLPFQSVINGWLNFGSASACKIFTFLINLLSLNCSAGTGLLSMMAARAMNLNDLPGHSTRGMVTACESYLPMVKLMRKVVHVNGMGRNINIINKRSDEIRVNVDIESRADVLVSIHIFMLSFALSLHYIPAYISPAPCKMTLKNMRQLIADIVIGLVFMYNISCLLR